MSSHPSYPPPPSRPPSYGRRPFPVAAVVAGVVVLVLVVGGGAYWLGRNNDNGSAAGKTPPAASGPASAEPSAATGAPSATAAVAPSAGASVPATASAGASQPGTVVAPTSVAVSPTVTSASPSPAVTTSPPVNPVPDFGYLHTVVTAGGVTKITFDRAILLTGPAAVAYAKAHNTELDDDYIIQNDNPLIRTWTLSPTAVITGSIQLSGKVESTPSTLDALKAFIPAHPKNFLPVDLYYDKNDTVTKIAEVYFP